MKKLALALTLAVLTICVNAGLQFPDLSTPHTNTTSSRGKLTVTNGIVYLADMLVQTNGSGAVTNIVKVWATNAINNADFFAYNSAATNYGDSAFTAWTYASNNAAFINFTITNFMGTNRVITGSTTNLTVTNGSVLNVIYITNGVIGRVQ